MYCVKAQMLEVPRVTDSQIITQGPITIFYSRIFIVAATIIIVCARKKNYYGTKEICSSNKTQWPGLLGRL